jgi:hypothetical protein
MMGCPECAEPGKVQIGQNTAARPAPQWTAMCGGCGHQWDFDD